jgi:hypothetical protein
LQKSGDRRKQPDQEYMKDASTSQNSACIGLNPAGSSMRQAL